MLKKSKTLNLGCILFVMIIVASVLTACSSVEKNGYQPDRGAGREVQMTVETEPVINDEPSPKKGITICVDPGHGYEDGGTGSDFLGDVLEKDITLSVSMKLKSHLEKRGFDVVMTHDGNAFPKTSVDDGNNRFKPQERTAFADSLGTSIDYYISLHCNAFDSPDVYGSIVFYVQDSIKGTVGDKEIASCLSDTISADFPESKCVANEGIYHVIRYTKVPASLIEMGYVTNESDAAKMLDEEWQDNFAESLAKGLDIYYSGEYVSVSDEETVNG